jgi:tRNA dimethylallyltransferase
MSLEPHPVIHVLTGCTAVGKTELALRWAERHGAEIISCDSLLFYRGMDIGTAKPSKEELARVPHHLVDICPVAEQMDVTRYLRLAQACAADIARRGRAILVAGGSGFYLKGYFSPVADGIEVPAEIRTRVRGLDEARALEELRALNPLGLGKLDTKNPRRVARALERCLASGETLAVLGERFARQASAFAGWELRLLRLDREPAELERRIESRVDSMLGAGLVEEVRHLRSQGLQTNPSAAGAIGYRETLAYLEGRLSAEVLRMAIIQSTRALVKKQRTWFKTQLPPHAVRHPARDYEFAAGWSMGS